jgi:hypothetical protein
MIVVNGGGATALVVRMRSISTMHADGHPPRVSCFVNGALWCQLYLFPHESRGMEGVAFDKARRVAPNTAELALLRARCPLLPSGARNVVRIEVSGDLEGGASNPEFTSSDARPLANPHFSEEERGAVAAAAVKDGVLNPHAPCGADAVANPHFDGVDSEGEVAGAAAAGAAAAAESPTARAPHYFVECSLYAWDASDRVCVCDIDGTITRTDLRDGFRTILAGSRGAAPEGRLVAHDGVCAFFSHLVAMASDPARCGAAAASGELRMLYLTARPISFAAATRVFLRELRQDGGAALPPGPLITNPGGVILALKSELSGGAAAVKAAALDELQQLFRAAGAFVAEPQGLGSALVCGFGNKAHDETAYLAAGVPICLSFIVQKGPSADVPLLILHGDARLMRRRSRAVSQSSLGGIVGDLAARTSSTSPRAGDAGCYSGYGDGALLEWLRSCLELLAAGHLPSTHELDRKST